MNGDLASLWVAQELWILAAPAEDQSAVSQSFHYFLLAGDQMFKHTSLWGRFNSLHILGNRDPGERVAELDVGQSE